MYIRGSRSSAGHPVMENDASLAVLKESYSLTVDFLFQCFICYVQYGSICLLEKNICESKKSIKWSKKMNGIQRPSLGPPWFSNHSKLIENTIGELSVKSQLTTHH